MSEATKWYQQGVAQRHAGLAEQSQASLEQALELAPGNPTVLRLAGYGHNCQRNDLLYQRIFAALHRLDRYPAPLQVEVLYAAAKALEDTGEIEAAFDHYAKAGALQKRLHPWSERPLNDLLALFQRHITPDLHTALRARGVPSDKPVFVFGMPRSGTSLVEQIIAAHPNASGLGEIKTAARVLDGIRVGRTRIDTGLHCGLPDPSDLHARGRTYLAEVVAAAEPDAVRIVDKMPGNYVWLGLLDAMLPGSRFVHCRRDPVATCLSAYKLYFGNEIPFSYDLRDLGRAYRLHMKFVRFWSDIVGDSRLLTIAHETLVSNLDHTVRRILNFLELPWNEAPLHYERYARGIQTASALQVKHRPTASRNWKFAEPYIGPLLEELENANS